MANADVRDFMQVVASTIEQNGLRPLHHQLQHLLDELPDKERELIVKYLYADGTITSSVYIIPGLLHLKLDSESLMKNGFPPLTQRLGSRPLVLNDLAATREYVSVMEEMLKEAVELLRVAKFADTELIEKCEGVIAAYDTN